MSVAVQKPAEPDALALATFADAVHAVVPVAGTDQRQAVDAEREALVKPARAVLEQRGDLVGNGGLEEAVVLAHREPRAFQEGNHLIQDGGRQLTHNEPYFENAKRHP